MYELILYLFMATLAVTLVIVIVFFITAVRFWRIVEQELDLLRKKQG